MTCRVQRGATSVAIGTQIWKVQCWIVSGGAVLRASMANTARLDVDAYLAGQRVVAWFTADDCLVLEQ